MIRYSDFLIYRLCESVMVSTSEFKKIIEDMPSTNKIADDIFSIIDDKKDVKTNYNAVGLSDKNDEISFIPDTQYQRSLSSGQDPWTKTKSKSKIGRMIRQILTDNQAILSRGNKYTDAQIEEFVNLFKAEWDKKNSVNRKIEIVNGDKILYWYNQDNYDPGIGGTLANSCMRHRSKNHFMKIYAENPDKISLVVLTESNKLIGRALLWKLDESSDGYKFYLDRIYTSNDSDYEYIYDWVLENVVGRNRSILGSHKHTNNSKKIIIKLKKTEFDEYPYADTFCYLYQKYENDVLSEEGFICDRDLGDSKYQDYLISVMQNTDGSVDRISHKWSSRYNKYIHRDQCVYSETADSFIYKSEAKFCKYDDSWYLESDVVYSESMEDWVPKGLAIETTKYGVVNQDALINVATKYIGKEDNPLDIYIDIQNNGEKIFEVEKFFEKDSEVSKVYYVPCEIRHFSNNILVSDIWGYKYPDFLCFTLYKVSRYDDKIDSRSIPYFNKDSDYYISKEHAKFYDIKIGTDNVYSYIIDYISQFNYNFYIDIIPSILDNSIPKEYKEYLEKIHDFKMKEDRSYRNNFSLYKLFAKEDPYKLIKSIIDKAILEAKEANWYRRDITNDFNYKVTTKELTDENDINNLILLTEATFGFYIITNKSSIEARELLSQLVGHFKDRLPETIINSIYELYSAFYNGIRYTYVDNMNDIISDLLNGYNIGDISRTEFMESLLKRCDKSKLLGDYKNLPIK